MGNSHQPVLPLESSENHDLEKVMPGDKYGAAIRILTSYRLTVTAPRIAVLNIFLASIVRHLNAEQLCALMLNGGYGIGITTFRRAIYDLASMGPVSRVLVPDQSSRTLTFYELADQPIHRHLYCTQCGAIAEVHDSGYEEALLRRLRPQGLKPANVDAALVGKCSDCQSEALSAGD